MIVRERLYTVEDVWRLECAPENASSRYSLIDGELIVSMSPSFIHGKIASEVSRHLGNFVVPRGLGDVTVESGHYPDYDRRTLLLPDVAFTSTERIPPPDPKSYAPLMPDLAVEIISPSQTLAQARRKARVYLQHGTAIVWLIDMLESKAEVWTLDSDGRASSEWIDSAGALDGGDVLPGFKLPLKRIFRA